MDREIFKHVIEGDFDGFSKEITTELNARVAKHESAVEYADEIDKIEAAKESIKKAGKVLKKR